MFYFPLMHAVFLQPGNCKMCLPDQEETKNLVGPKRVNHHNEFLIKRQKISIHHTLISFYPDRDRLPSSAAPLVSASPLRGMRAEVKSLRNNPVLTQSTPQPSASYFRLGSPCPATAAHLNSLQITAQRCCQQLNIYLETRLQLKHG